MLFLERERKTFLGAIHLCQISGGFWRNKIEILFFESGFNCEGLGMANPPASPFTLLQSRNEHPTYKLSQLSSDQHFYGDDSITIFVQELFSKPLKCFMGFFDPLTLPPPGVEPEKLVSNKHSHTNTHSHSPNAKESYFYYLKIKNLFYCRFESNAHWHRVYAARGEWVMSGNGSFAIIVH